MRRLRVDQTDKTTVTEDTAGLRWLRRTDARSAMFANFASGECGKLLRTDRS
jgi:hypothetical protein